MEFPSPRTVLITQSNYLPWRGFFAAMRSADVVVLLDNVQYTRRDWRNRNRIRVCGTEKWLTIPVVTKGLYRAPISAILTEGDRWGDVHGKTIRQAYRRFPGEADVEDIAASVSEVARETRFLSEINRALLRDVARRLKIDTPVATVTEPDEYSANERLLNLASAHGATRYLTGPSAAAYLDEAHFAKRGIEIQYLDYSRLAPDPDAAASKGELSIVDVLARRPDEAVDLSTFFDGCSVS